MQQILTCKQDNAAFPATADLFAAMGWFLEIAPCTMSADLKQFLLAEVSSCPWYSVQDPANPNMLTVQGFASPKAIAV